MPKCASPHPDIAGLTCRAKAGTFHHDHFGRTDPMDMTTEVYWPNEAQPRPVAGTKTSLVELRDQITPETPAPLRPTTMTAENGGFEWKMEQGWKNATPRQRDTLLGGIHQTAKSKQLVTVDDVFETLESRGIHIESGHDRAIIGQAMMEAKRLGWIEGTDTFVRPRYYAKSRHTIRQWRSLVYVPTT